MILNNYWKYLKVMMENVPGGNTTLTTNMICTDGSYALYGLSYYQENTQIKSNGTVRIGRGNNTYTADDYALADDITSSISNLEWTYASAVEDDTLKRIITIAGVNASASNLTITEVAYQKSMQYVGGGYIRYAPVLMNIAKLSNPVTVPPSSNFVIVLEWDEM